MGLAFRLSLILASLSVVDAGVTFPVARAQSLLAAASEAESFPLYSPPQKLSPRARIGGQLRGTEGLDPEVQALVPDHVGVTVKQTPILNWFTSKPTGHKVTFTLTSAESIRPVYEGVLPGPVGEGFHSIDLKTLGLSLEPEVQYRWYVSVERTPESPSQDIVAGGVIERCEFSACLSEGQPNLSCNQQSVVDNARGGFWYDAMGCLCQLIESNPAESSLRRLRANLLKQVGLHAVADWDLRSLQSSSR